MVSAEELKQRFEYKEGRLFWKDGRRKGQEVGWVNEQGYRYCNFKLNDKNLRMAVHQIIFVMHHGYLPNLIDHIDRNCYNNKIENLREADKSLNALNTIPRSNNQTGVKGVFKIRTGRYEASVWFKGKKVYLGLYDTVEEATRRIQDFKSFRCLT